MALKKDFSATGAAFSFAQMAFSGATACNKPTRNTPAPTAASSFMGFGFGSGK